MKWRELFCVTLREVKFDLKLIGNYVQSTKKLSKGVVVLLFLFLLPLGPLLLQLLGEVLHPTSHLGKKLFQTRSILKLLRFAHIW